MSTWLGKELWKQSQVSFAYLQSPGYCANSKCTTFPVLVGETGSAYKTDSDKQWLLDFADFAYARVSHGWVSQVMYAATAVMVVAPDVGEFSCAETGLQ